MTPTLLIVDDDELIALGLAAALEQQGRRIIVCHDIEAAQLIIETEPVTDIAIDVRLTGPFRFEGLDFLTHVRSHAPHASVVLITGQPTDDLATEAKQRGARGLLSKPFDVDVLEEFLAPAGDGDAIVQVTPTLGEIVASPLLRPQFQPIVSLENRAIRGFEALARFRAPSVLSRPDRLFDYATRKERAAELEIACVTRMFDEAVVLPSDVPLFVNSHPAAIGARAWSEAVLTASSRTGIALNRLVVEITEQQPLRDPSAVLSSVGRLREHGVRFAFDDMGIAYSHLPLIERIRPEYIKISQEFGGGFELDPTRRKIVANLAALGRDFGCDVVIEGIETEETAVAARDLGIPLAQGWLFGRPADAQVWQGPRREAE